MAPRREGDEYECTPPCVHDACAVAALASVQDTEPAMTTKLDKPLRREIEIDERAYTLTIDADGFRLVEKGRRKGQELRWRDVVNGDAALAAGLAASLQAAEARR